MSSHFDLRFFNEQGIVEFEDILAKIRTGVLTEIPPELYLSDNYSEVYDPIVKIQKEGYRMKLELITYLVGRLNLHENKNLYYDTGVWSWLSAFYFNSVCPLDDQGKRRVNEAAFYVLREPKDYTKYNRHLLAYPCRIYSEIGDSAKIFLSGTFSKRGELTEQFGAYQDISLSKGIVDAANLLYWDNSTGTVKRGAAGKGAGSVRRLVRILRQYQMTFDFKSMSGTDIYGLLPAEFDRWKKS